MLSSVDIRKRDILRYNLIDGLKTLRCTCTSGNMPLRAIERREIELKLRISVHQPTGVQENLCKILSYLIFVNFGTPPHSLGL